jgi:hypothetical protein
VCCAAPASGTPLAGVGNPSIQRKKLLLLQGYPLDLDEVDKEGLKEGLKISYAHRKHEGTAARMGGMGGYPGGGSGSSGYHPGGGPGPGHPYQQQQGPGPWGGGYRR